MSETQAPSFWHRLVRWKSWKRFWIPLALVIAALFLSIQEITSGWISNTLGFLFLGGLLYFLVAAIFWFVKKRIAAGWASLLCLGVAILSFFPAMAYLFVLGMMEEDTFAKDLSLPQGIPLEEPAERDWRNDSSANETDTFQTALRSSLRRAGSSDESFLASIPSLSTLQQQNPLLLRQFLAAHPGWRVYEEQEKRYATRRWMVNGEWVISLHGYYSDFGSASDEANFQSRTTLGLSGKPWWRGAPSHPAGEVVTPRVETANSLYETHLSFKEGDITVELFEQSDARERRLTKTALAQMEKEFSQLLEAENWSAVRDLLPTGSIRNGPASFRLFNSMQPGIYNAEIRCNPGEPGEIYLKAFEITQETRLSEGRLADRASEFVGWSDDPEEQFFSDVHFTIYEGNWGEFYGARFEVWFRPEGGGEERKLMESNWKIEGWMR